METNFLPINQISGVKDSYLSLEGTILIFWEKNSGKETALQIPVELISILEKKRIKAALLIKALLSLFASLILGVAWGNITFNLLEEDSIYQRAAIIIFLLILLAGLITFFVFLIKFFRRAKTVCLTIAPNNGVIEFWKEPKYAQQIDEFINQIKQRQASTEETLANPAKSFVGFVDEPSLIRKWFGLTILSCLPAAITKKPILLLLALLPAIWFLYRKVQFLTQPKEYRQAVKYYFRKDWGSVINSIKHLQERLPNVVHIPSISLLVATYVRMNKFDDAITATSMLPDELVDLARQMQTDIWQSKRVYDRRNENIISENKQ